MQPDLLALQEIAARLLPGSGRPTVERTPAGVSTPVFRIRRGGTTLYLRLAESAQANLAPEAQVHGLLRNLGVHVPEVVHFEPHNEALGRSLMVTSEIAGSPIGSMPRDGDGAAVLEAAGRELALIHTIPVDGFGWIQRDRPDSTRLQAALPTLHAFMLDDLPERLARLDGVLAAGDLQTIGRAIAGGVSLLTRESAVLVHGDFDATHIFHRRGEYTGIIDFGEIRGADPLYDLGHFALHDGEQIPTRLLPSLQAGYRDVMPLPPDAEARIRLWSLLICVNALARSVGRPRSGYQDHLHAIRKVGGGGRVGA